MKHTKTLFWTTTTIMCLLLMPSALQAYTSHDDISPDHLEAASPSSSVHVEGTVNATWTNFHYYEVEEGDVFKITWIISNTGSLTAKDVRLTLLAPSGLQLLSENTTSLDELFPSSTTEVEYVFSATRAHFWNFKLGYDKRPIAYRVTLKVEGEDIGKIIGKNYVRIHVRLSRDFVIVFSVAIVLVFLMIFIHGLFTHHFFMDRQYVKSFLMWVGGQGSIVIASVLPIWLFLEREYPIQFILWLFLIGGLLYLSYKLPITFRVRGSEV